MPATMTVPGKAPGSGCETDDDATSAVLALERKSVQQYRDQDEYVYAMKEDLAEWLNTLYGVHLTVDNFFEELETGVLLCEHANNVQSFILERTKESDGLPLKPRPGHRPLGIDPEKIVAYRSKVKTGSFQSRDNVSNFIEWTHRLGLPDCLLFETEDLVLRKNERSVVLCLLEVARQGARYGMQAPMLVQLEEEIDAEIAGDPPAAARQRITCDLMSLDEMVREMLGQCTCPDSFPMYRVSEGKYQVGDSRTLIFVRILRKHVMVRIGGGWDTLENYLDRHDPCRCQHKGHRAPRSSPRPANQAKRRGSAPQQSTEAIKSRATSTEPKHHTRTQDKSCRSNSLVSGQAGSPTHSQDPHHSLSPPSSMKRPSVGHASRAHYNSEQTSDMTSKASISRKVLPHGNPSRNGTVTKHWASKPKVSQYSLQGSNATDKLDGNMHLETGRTVDPPTNRSHGIHSRGRCTEQNLSCNIGGKTVERSSARTPRGRSLERKTPGLARASTRECQSLTPSERGRSRERPRTLTRARGRSEERSSIPTPQGQSRERTNDEDTNNRGRARERSGSTKNASRTVRSRSVGASELHNQLFRTAPAAFNRKARGQDTLTVTRNHDGRHTIISSKPKCSDPDSPNRANGKSTAMSILPDKPKILGRSHTVDIGSPTEDEASERCQRLASSTMSLNSLSYDEYPEPEADASLNEQMERLFEEYRQIELGLYTKQLNALTDAANNMATPETRTAGSGERVETNTKLLPEPNPGQAPVTSETNGKKPRTTSNGSLLDNECRPVQGTAKTPSPRTRSPAPTDRVPKAKLQSTLSNEGAKMTRGRSPVVVARVQSVSPSPIKQGPVRTPQCQMKTPAGHTPARRCQSPAPSSQGPAPRGPSPAPRGQSPAPRGRSPVPRSQSPAPRGPSPAPRGQSPAPRGPSPAPRGQSPAPRGQSPAPKGQRPAPRSPSPAPRGKSPAPRGRSPVPGSHGRNIKTGGRSPIPCPTPLSSVVSSPTYDSQKKPPTLWSEYQETVAREVGERQSAVSSSSHQMKVAVDSEKQSQQKASATVGFKASAHKTPQGKTIKCRPSAHPIRTNPSKINGCPKSHNRSTDASASTPIEAQSEVSCEEYWPKIDVLCDVPQEGYADREARVAAYVNSVRETMDVVKSTSAKLTTDCAPGGPGVERCVTGRLEDRRPHSSMGIRAASIGPNKTTKVRSRSREDLLDGRQGRAAGSAGSKAISDTQRSSSVAGNRRGSMDIPGRTSTDPRRTTPLDGNSISARPSMSRSHSTCGEFLEPARITSAPDMQDTAAQTVDLAAVTGSSSLLNLAVDTPTKATPRRAKVGGRTRIPGPASSRTDWKASEAQPLRRYDSGVDINNMSPTGTSVPPEETWAHHGHLVVTDHMAGHVSDSDEYY